jgi:hypothetical protein
MRNWEADANVTFNKYLQVSLSAALPKISSGLKKKHRNVPTETDDQALTSFSPDSSSKFTMDFSQLKAANRGNSKVHTNGLTNFLPAYIII